MWANRVGVLTLCCLAAGCGSKAKVIEAKRVESVTARTGGSPDNPEHSVVQPVDAATDFLLITFDAGSRPEGRPPSVPTLTDDNGKRYDPPSKEWNQKMGNHIKLWWAVRRAQDSFILEFDGQRFPLKAPGNVRPNARDSAPSPTKSEAAVADAPEAAARSAQVNRIVFKGNTVELKAAIVKARKENLKIFDLFLSTRPLTCADTRGGEGTEHDFTMMIPLTVKRPLAVGTVEQPGIMLAAPGAGITFAVTQGNLHLDAIDQARREVRGSFALAGMITTSGKFTAKLCEE